MTRLELYPYQKAVLPELERRKRIGLFWDLGTGKTPVALELLRRLADYEFPAVVIAPAYLIPHWKNEYEKCVGDSRVFDLSAALKDKFEFNKNVSLRNFRCVFLISYSLLRSRKHHLFIRRLSQATKTLILDESIKIANPQTAITKLLTLKNVSSVPMFYAAPRKILLCGRPMTESELQIFAQYRLLSESVFGRDFWAFRRKYFQPDWFGTTWTIKESKRAEFQEKVNSMCLRLRREEALPHLPGSMRVELRGNLDSTEKDMLRELKKKWGIKFGEVSYFTNTAIAMYSKQQQLSCGFMKVKEQEAFLSDVVEPHKEVGRYNYDRKHQAYVYAKIPSRTKVLKNILGEVPAGASTVIFCAFKADLRIIKSHLFKKTPRTMREISGDISQDVRDAYVKDFRAGKFQFLLATTASISSGVNLVGTQYMIFYSHIHSFNMRDQAEARPQRHGQKDKLCVFDIVMEGTLDEDIMEAYKRKMSLDKWLRSKHES